MAIETQQSPGLARLMAGGAATSFVVKIAGVGLAFLLQLLLARLLGLRGFGVYMYVITWLNVAVMLGKAGLDTASLRFLAEYRGTRQLPAFFGFLRYARRYSLAASLAVVVVGGGVLAVSWPHLPRDLAWTFLVSLPAVPVSCQMELATAALQALRRVGMSQVPGLVARPLLVGLLCLSAAAALEEQLPPPGAMLAYAAACTLVAALAVWLLRTVLSGEPEPRGREQHAAQWRRAAARMLLAAVFTLLLRQTDVLLLGMFRSANEVGMYAAATRLSGFVTFGLLSIMALGAPVISQLHAQRQQAELQQVAGWIAWGGGIFALPVALLLGLAPAWCLSWFGTEFVPADRALVVLAIGQFVNAGVGPVGFLLIMTGHEGRAATLIAICAGANLALNLILIPPLGMLGAAVATSASMIAWNLLLLKAVAGRLQVNPTILQRPRLPN